MGEKLVQINHLSGHIVVLGSILTHEMSVFLQKRTVEVNNGCQTLVSHAKNYTLSRINAKVDKQVSEEKR